jgi:hypothetical protein
MLMGLSQAIWNAAILSYALIPVVYGNTPEPTRLVQRAATTIATASYSISIDVSGALPLNSITAGMSASYSLTVTASFTAGQLPSLTGAPPLPSPCMNLSIIILFKG